MICPKCKEGELKEQTSVKGFFRKLKEITYYCPCCDFENKRQFKLSKEDVEIEKIERMNKPKETIQKYYSERKEEKR